MQFILFFKIFWNFGMKKTRTTVSIEVIDKQGYQQSDKKYTERMTDRQTDRIKKEILQYDTKK